MQHHLAFLHTAHIHVETFSKLVAEVNPGLRARHDVRASLLEEARQRSVPEGLAQRIQTAMTAATSSGASIVVCTCSTIGGLAEATEGNFRAMRIDRPMADAAVKQGHRVLVLAALESTLGPTIDLLRDSARAANVAPQMTELLVRDAWDRFEVGEHEGYISTIAEAIRLAAHNADVIVLAQASMAPAAERCADISIPVLSSPRMGVKAAVEATLRQLKNASSS